MSNKKCSICGRPVGSPATGSFTQWLSTCRCDRLEDRGAADHDTKALSMVCSNCGRPIRKVDTGSFTQWVSRASACDCEQPLAVPALAALPKQSEPSLSDAANLERDPEKFPLDRYQPIRKLGTGASATVTLCNDKRLNKQVAVKVLRVASQEQLVSFQTEAKVLARLRHSNIVSILDFGVTAHGAPYMVLEHRDGTPFDKVLQEVGHIDEMDLIAIGIDIADALAYAHNQGIFHRDIKSANVLLSAMPDGRLSVLLIDFGIAFLQDEAPQNLEFQGRTIVGTPRYMSPDQLLGRRFDARSEIYSVGCLLYEMLSGKLPFYTSDPLALLEMHANNPVPRFSEICPDIAIGSKIKQIIYKCLEKEPENRYQSMEELIKELRSIQLAGTAIRQEKAQAQNKPAPSRSHAATLIAPVVLAVCLAAFLAVRILERPAGRNPAPKERRIQTKVPNSANLPVEPDDLPAESLVTPVPLPETGDPLVEGAANYSMLRRKAPILREVLAKYPNLDRAYNGERFAAFHNSPMGEMWMTDDNFQHVYPGMRMLWGDLSMIPVLEDRETYEYIKTPSNWLPINGKPRCDAPYRSNKNVLKLVSDKRFQRLAADPRFRTVMTDKRLQDFIADRDNYRLVHAHMIDLENRPTNVVVSSSNGWWEYFNVDREKVRSIKSQPDFRNLVFHDVAPDALSALPVIPVVSIGLVQTSSQHSLVKLIKSIRRLPTLRELQIVRDGDITSDDLAEISKLSQIDTLGLTCSGTISSSGLSKLKKLPNLRILILEFNEHLNASIKSLNGANQIEQLWLAHTDLDGECVKDIATHRRLQFIDVSHTRIKADDLSPMANLANLKEIRIGSSSASLANSGPYDWRTSAVCTKLKVKLPHLNFSDRQYTDDLGIIERARVKLWDKNHPQIGTVK